MLCVLSTHNIGFYEDLTKIIFELSSNTHLISSAALIVFLKEVFEKVNFEKKHQKTKKHTKLPSMQ